MTNSEKKTTLKGEGGNYEPESHYKVELNRTVTYHKIQLRPSASLIISGAILNAIPQDAIVSTNRV